MGKRGPKPKPTTVAKRLGSHHLADRKSEVTPETGRPGLPAWLSPRARKCWARIAPLLEKEGLLTRLDGTALALLCEPLADYILAREIVDAAAQESGTRFITTTDKGNLIQHPAVGVMNKAWEKVVKLLREFGMTPSARAGLAIANKKPPEDPMADLLRRMTQAKNN